MKTKHYTEVDEGSSHQNEKNGQDIIEENLEELLQNHGEFPKYILFACVGKKVTLITNFVVEWNGPTLNDDNILIFDNDEFEVDELSEGNGDKLVLDLPIVSVEEEDSGT